METFAGGLTFTSALATWFTELPALADAHHCVPVATSVTAVWLQAIADISAQPHACILHLQPLYRAVNGVLEHHARGVMHEGTVSHSVKHMHESLIDPVAKLCWVSPVATASMLTMPPRAMNLLVHSITCKFAAQLAVAAGTVAPDTASAACAVRCAAFGSATCMMRAMSALAVVQSHQRALVATGEFGFTTVLILFQPGQSNNGIMEYKHPAQS